MPNFLIPSLLLPLFMNLLVIPCPCGGSDYYVKPSDDSVESECPSSVQHYMTLNEYANTQDFEDDVTLLFLAGIHYLTTNLTLSHLNETII